MLIFGLYYLLRTLNIFFQIVLFTNTLYFYLTLTGVLFDSAPQKNLKFLGLGFVPPVTLVYFWKTQDKLIWEPKLLCGHKIQWFFCFVWRHCTFPSHCVTEKEQMQKFKFANCHDPRCPSQVYMVRLHKWALWRKLSAIVFFHNGNYTSVADSKYYLLLFNATCITFSWNNTEMHLINRSFSLTNWLVTLPCRTSEWVSTAKRASVNGPVRHAARWLVVCQMQAPREVTITRIQQKTHIISALIFQSNRNPLHMNHCI